MMTGETDGRVTVFDAWENYDMLNGFFVLSIKVICGRRKSILTDLTRAPGKTM